MEVLKDYPKEFSELFRLSFNYLSKINMIQRSKDDGFIQRYWRFFYIIPCYVIFFITMVLYIGKLAVSGQIIEIAFMMPPVMIALQGILKAIIIISKTSIVFAMMKELGDLWKTRDLTETQKNKRDALLKKITLYNKKKSQKKLTYTENCIKILKFQIKYRFYHLLNAYPCFHSFTVTFWVTLFVTIQYLTTPLAETLVRRSIMNQDSELMLIIDCSYPFDPAANWLVYSAVYAFQCCCLYLYVCSFTGVEMIMIILCGLLGIEFTLLCEDMLQVKPEFKKKTKASNSFKANEEVFTIKDFVKRHQKLCALTTLLDEAFNQIAFIDVLFSGLTTCTCGYGAQFCDDQLYVVTQYIAASTNFLSIFCLCYFGEVLAESSSRIGDVAYHNLWYNGHKEYQKSIYIIIIRSQKSCCLTSMRYVPIKLNLFTKVMSTTWSYFSLMNYIYGDK